ncbi:hypothetical protein Tco_1416237, partial [Tanacetum coccineum]
VEFDEFGEYYTSTANAVYTELSRMLEEAIATEQPSLLNTVNKSLKAVVDKKLSLKGRHYDFVKEAFDLWNLDFGNSASLL